MSRPDAPAFFVTPVRDCPWLKRAVLDTPEPLQLPLCFDEPPPGERVAEGPMIELLGSGYYFAPFDKLSALDAARLISALK